MAVTKVSESTNRSLRAKANSASASLTVNEGYETNPRYLELFKRECEIEDEIDRRDDRGLAKEDLMDELDQVRMEMDRIKQCDFIMQKYPVGTTFVNQNGVAIKITDPDKTGKIQYNVHATIDSPATDCKSTEPESLEKILADNGYELVNTPVEESKKDVCVICGKEIEGYGNNAAPVKDGRCCDDCHYNVVVPARLKGCQNKKLGESANTNHDSEFDYKLMDRLRSDCEYFINYFSGKGTEKVLWAGNVADQIAKMKELYDKVPVKPEWLTMQDIEGYEYKMNQLLGNKVSESKMKYFNIEVNGEILEDDFGNPYRFDTFDEAQAYIDEMELENAEVIGQVNDKFTESVKKRFVKVGKVKVTESAAVDKLKAIMESGEMEFDSAKIFKFAPDLDKMRTLDDKQKQFVIDNMEQIDRARDLVAEAYDIIASLHYSSDIKGMLGQVLGIMDQDLSQAQTNECLNGEDAFENSFESTALDPEDNLTESFKPVFGDNDAEDITDYSQLLEKYYGEEAVTLAKENDLSAKSVYFFMECHGALDPILSLKEELENDFDKKEFTALYE